MKKIILIAAAIFSIMLFTSPQKAYAQVAASITFQDFYDDLSGYGTWIDYPSYGNVWRPDVQTDFRPYLTNGYWAYTNTGWFWASNYEWGWAAFHYGYWIYDDYYGWLWVPGYIWGPGWVTWGSYDGYYAWAPLMPGVNVQSAFGSWRPHSFYWNIVPQGKLYDRNLSADRISDQSSRKIASQLKVMNSFATLSNNKASYATGPQKADVERITQQSISISNVVDYNKPGKTSLEGSSIKTYRPEVSVATPKVVRSAQEQKVNPIVNESQWPTSSSNYQTQSQNTQSLPMMQSGMSSRSGGASRGGGRR